MKSVLITSSILILLIAALRPLLRGKIDPRVQYALWLIAALRLLIPVNFVTSAYSILSLLSRAEEPIQIVQTIGQTTVPLPGISYEDAYDQALREYQQNKPAVTSFTDLNEVEHRAQELQAQRPTLAELAQRLARPVWLGGAAIMAFWFLLVNLRLRRKLRLALPVEADCPLPVYVTPELPSPCLCGVFRPVIYVTPDALTDPDRLRHVLTHETTHYRHRDHWWVWVRCLCLCLYWFDPLVWWAAALSRQDCELACDEGAIRRLGEGERIPYGRTLVAMIAAGRNSLLQTATTMTGNKRRVQERIKLIARKPKTVAAVVLALVVIVGCAVGCTFTGAPEEDAPPPPATTAPDPEPLSSQALTADTLQERLMAVPEYLQGTVEASASETKWAINDIALVSYWWDVPAEWKSERFPWLLDVHREERRFIDAHGWADDNDDQIREIIAQDEEFYYVIERPVDTRFQMEDSEPFTAAYQAIRDYAEQQVLETEGVEPYLPEPAPAPDEVAAVVNGLLAAPSVDLHLSIGLHGVETPKHIGYGTYSTVPNEDFCSSTLSDMLTSFSWEEFDWGTTEDPRFPVPPPTSSYLSITASDYSAYVRVWEDSDLVAVHDSQNGTKWYHARYTYDTAREISTFEYLRRFWFDRLELDCLRASGITIADRDRSHEEIAREWAEGYEGAMYRVAPDSSYACTYVEITDVKADLPDWLEDEEQLAEFAAARGLPAGGFGTGWFGFSYQAVLVPVDQTTTAPFWVGNTQEYQGDGAPEGALTYSRVGILHRTSQGWVCEGSGTGW